MGYLELIDSYKENMLADLKELVNIPSVIAPACIDKDYGKLPFGKEVDNAFRWMLSRAEIDGFSTCNTDNYGGHIEMAAREDSTDTEIMGILGHLDVVPEGSGWKSGDGNPFSGSIEDGKVYGRGTCDDKGPVLAAYYAMKALKESGFEPSKRIRLILGLDEETNWIGMHYYLEHVDTVPTFGFTPDADFPAIHGEKGILVFRLAKKIGKSNNKGLELRSLNGGSAANMVPDFARAVVRNEQPGAYEVIREKANAFREETGYHLQVKGTGKNLEITTTGQSAHGSTPYMGVNAIAILYKFLGGLSFANEDVNEFIAFANEHIGFEWKGESMGCSFCDEASGDLIFNLGMAKMTPEVGEFTVNIRYPVTYTEEAVYEGMMPLLNKYNFGVVKEKGREPIYFPADDPLIVTLMDVYKEHTGDVDGKPIVIGGGTYARATKGIVAFGPRFPGEEEMAHQRDEYISIDSLMKAAKIYADAIYKLTK
jgi:succinyl-diaminopimelate desuccinylase